MPKEREIPKNVGITFHEITSVPPQEGGIGWRVTVVMDGKTYHAHLDSEQEANDFYSKFLTPVLEVIENMKIPSMPILAE
jgi:hypothetical protein